MKPDLGNYNSGSNYTKLQEGDTIYEMVRSNKSDGQITLWKFYPPDRQLSGEERLAMAVLEVAIKDWQSTTAKLIHKADAVDWFGRDDWGPFSFNQICQGLGIEIDYIRRLMGPCVPTGKSASNGEIRNTRAEAVLKAAMAEGDEQYGSIASRFGVTIGMVRHIVCSRMGQAWMRERAQRTERRGKRKLRVVK